MSDLAAKDRLIVALDVPTYKEAMDLVTTLTNVSFFKVGLQLFLTGQVIPLIQALRNERDGQVFLDIKWGGDIGNTAREFVQACIESSVVKFITLIEATSKAITEETVKAGKEVRKAAGVEYPHFLMVPYLSSLDSGDLKQTQNLSDLNAYILRRGKAMLDLGCDGLIVSGDAIELCRKKFGSIDIVSPGIRPSWASQDDHKRFTTPSRAMKLGATYLVVGRPIIGAANKRDAAQRIIDEIDGALQKKSTPSGSGSGQLNYTRMAALSS